MESTLQCFIVALPNSDTSSLRRILKSKKVGYSDAYDFQIGNGLQDDLLTKIKNSDFAVVIFNKKSPDIYYEMGICEGANIPIFIIVDRGMEVPPFAQKHTYIRTSVSDNFFLESSLSKFIDDHISNKNLTKRKISRATNYLKTDNLDDYLEEIRHLRNRCTSRQLEEFTERFISHVGINYASNKFTPQLQGADFIIWNNNLTASLGNPILIEIKCGLLHPRKIQLAEIKLQKQLEISDANVAVLLYLDKNSRKFTTAYSLVPLVIRFDFEDFIIHVLNSSFEGALLERRNKMIHGVID